MSPARRCPYCQCVFVPSIYRPRQRVCGQPECQRRRRSDYHRQKLVTDPEYRQVVRESQKQWWDEQKRRLGRLVRNNLALDLKDASSEVWLLGPKLRDLDRNNLASAQVLVLPSLSLVPTERNAS